jgi:hypothetical protein
MLNDKLSNFKLYQNVPNFPTPPHPNTTKLSPNTCLGYLTPAGSVRRGQINSNLDFFCPSSMTNVGSSTWRDVKTTSNGSNRSVLFLLLWIITLVFKKNDNFSTKSAKIAEINDHNIDPSLYTKPEWLFEIFRNCFLFTKRLRLFTERGLVQLLKMAFEDKGQLLSIASRVTRLGEFSPIGRLVMYVGLISENYKSRSNYWANFFHGTS